MPSPVLQLQRALYSTLCTARILLLGVLQTFAFHKYATDDDDDEDDDDKQASKQTGQ